MKDSELDKLILKIEARSSAELKKHTEGPGTRYVFADHKNNQQGNIYSIVRIVKDVDNPRTHIEMHSHNCDSLWEFLGDNDDLTGLRVEVTLEHKKYVLDSPVSVYIPKQVNHTYRFINGSGKYINTVLAKDGKYNTTITEDL